VTTGEADVTASAGRGARGSLLERGRELASLGDLAAEAAAGQPGVLVIEGAAGIGKTRLLAEGRGLVRDAGATVLVARGGELEQGLAFGIVRQLFETAVIGQADDLLRGAARAGREVFLPPAMAIGSERFDDASFAILHALYWLTVNLAADGPLVLAVDDLHWCDEPSLRYFTYLVRRLEGLSVTVMCTTRSFERRAQAALLGEIAGDPLAVLLRPGPLSPRATAQLVTERLGDAAEEPFAAACHTATGGNPLLLGELLKALHAEGVPPDAGHVSSVADIGPRAASRAVLVRLARLPADTARLARAAAVLGEGAELPVVAELAGVELDLAAVGAGELAAAEIICDQAAIAFVHPLVGAAVYQDVPASERSLAHERAAFVLHERGVAPGTVATHLLLAPPRAAEWVCDILEQAAHASLRAGAPASAVAYLTRALAEPPPARARAQLLLELGRAEALIDGHAAAKHLAQARELSDDLRAPGSPSLELARALLFTGRAGECVALVRGTIAEIGPESGDLRRRLEAVGLMATLFGHVEPATPEQLERYRELPVGKDVGAKMLAAVAARHWTFAGGPADACARLALGALEGGELIAADNVLLSFAAIKALVLADRPEADDAWKALLQDAHARGSLPAKAAISMWRGYALYRRGELADAEASIHGAFEEFALWNSGAEGPVHLAGFLSAVLRERGEPARARLALHAAADPGDASDAARYWLDSLTRLLICEGRFDEAITVAEESERRFAFLANPIDTPARSHRAVALDRLGRHEEALALGVQELELAGRWGAPATLGRALRILGTLERDAGLGHLRRAVEVVDGSTARLEFAKALAALGTALRATRRPTEAREPLRRALELADALGARALATHARAELHAAGGRPRTKALQGPGALTPSERRVTERAASGQTNREIAESLFVTPKTVELHLRNAYRKLGASSRRELAGKLETP
jgi:DNA-binding CsgD family transcriptional regulator